jgi:hypothetical protein
MNDDASSGLPPRAPLALMVRLLSRHSSWSDAERLEVERLPHEIRFAARGERLVSPGHREENCHLLLTAFAHKANSPAA